jgi:hypothetical protein
MLGYVRARPLLFAAFIVASVLGIGFLAVVIAVLPASIRNSSPAGYAGHAAEFYGRNPHLQPFRRYGIGETGDRLFGVTEAEGIALLRACIDDKWVFLGKEEKNYSDCNEYELARCDIDDTSLISRRWVGMGFEGVDFTACKSGLCPDFAVGEPTVDPFSCGTPYKIRISTQDNQ